MHKYEKGVFFMHEHDKSSLLHAWTW
jgi:hypothetical protein